MGGVARGNPWGVMGFLILAAILSLLDRQILSLMVDPIKADLGISDVQMSLLQGLAFALFYSVAGLGFGWAADRFNRRNIIAAGIAGWSVMTAACGLAGSFWQLFLARAGVGVGEASLGPAAHSMICDLFPTQRLPLAMSVYGLGVAFGTAGAYMLGGQLIHFVSAAPPVVLPGLGALAVWQTVFLAVGLPGALIALLFFGFVREPVRAAISVSRSGERGLIAYAREHFGLSVLLILGIGSLTASGYAILAWTPAFLERSFGWTPQQAGLTLGSLILLLSAPGMVLTGFWSSRLIAKGRTDAAITLAAACGLVGAPLFAAAYLAGAPEAYMALVIAPTFLGSAYVGLGPAMVQLAIPPHLRGRASAASLLLTGLIGMLGGPLSVAILTDWVFRDELRVGWSLGIAAGGLSALGALFLWLARPAWRSAHAALAGADGAMSP